MNINDNKYYLGNVGKKTLETNKRIEDQIERSISERMSSIHEEEKSRQEQLQETLMNNAKFSTGSAYMRRKQRQEKARQLVEYNNAASSAVLTDIISNIVNESLLLEQDEFEVINPNYKETIRETVKGFIENANLNDEIQEKRTVRIIEHVMMNLPIPETGIYLKEEDIIDMVNDNSSKDIDKDISSLTGDVKKRVANIVSREQGETEKIQKEIDDIVELSEAAKAKKAAKKAKKDEKKEEKTAKEGSEKDEKLEKEDPKVKEEVTEEVSEDPDYEDDDLLDLDDDDSGKTDARRSRKKTEIHMANDGSVKFIIREQFVRETPKKGLIESLALNEAMEMIQEGKEYNGDLALANALMVVTILETFNITGLLTVTNDDYARIIGSRK